MRRSASFPAIRTPTLGAVAITLGFELLDVHWGMRLGVLWVFFMASGLALSQTAQQAHADFERRSGARG